MDRSLFSAAAIVVAAIAMALVAWPSPSDPPPIEFVGSVARRTVTVHVSGAVVRPGLVTLESDARVADAVAAAGGATPDAHLGALNLAATVGDGARLVVPSGTGDTAVTDGLIRVNSASLSDLERLPGVGPVLAQHIVTHRDKNGPFDVVEDLLAVPGIGEVKLAGMRDSVLVP
ncbi:MAG: ComEA family DNA-binding protein [Acidimicrobiia bacterium]